ncbi:uncharacterized protein LOC139921488 isoform X1 [Centroberyx gerrardi]
MEESVDVKALRAKFHGRTNTSDSGSWDSGSPKSPRPGFGRGVLPGTENGLVRHKLSPTVPPPLSGPGAVRFPGPRAPSSPRPPAAPLPQAVGPRTPPSPGLRAAAQPPDSSRVKQTGEMLQNMMLRHQGPQSARPGPSTPSTPSTPSIPSKPIIPGTPSKPVIPGTPSKPSIPAPGPGPARQLPGQRAVGDVTPLRRPLPHEGPRPMKPRRPPAVNLEPYLRSSRAPAALPAPRRSEGSSGSGGSRLSLPGLFSPPGSGLMNLPRPGLASPLGPGLVSPPGPGLMNLPRPGLASPLGPGLMSPPGLPQRPNKPSSLPHQPASVQIEDNQDTYDDIGSFEQHDSWSDSSQCMEAGSDEVYEFIDEDQLELNRSHNEKKTQKEVKRQQEQEKKDQKERQKERQKRENELRKNFQLQGEVEVLHTAKVRHDWHGGKLDLSVRQGDSVEILRVKNNPGGRWLARSLTGNYGYISNTCVDIDYEEVKRKVLQARGIDPSPLPPPPPDPPLTNNITYMDSSNHTDSLAQEEEDDYDDVQPISEDFPPPPPEISIDPKLEKELKKKFKFEGPLTVLHTMMVDPNGVIKKLGGKDLSVAQGEVLDVIQLTSDKKALCRNQYGKYGYVSRSLLLQMEGDIYDDVDHFDDIYDNDSVP